MLEKRKIGVLDIFMILILYLPSIHMLYAKSPHMDDRYYNTTLYYHFTQYAPILIYLIDTIFLLKTKRFKRWPKGAKLATILGYILCLPSFIFSIAILLMLVLFFLEG